MVTKTEHKKCRVERPISYDTIILLSMKKLREQNQQQHLGVKFDPQLKFSTQRQLKLPTSKYRRTRGDIITVFKIVTNKEKISKVS